MVILPLLCTQFLGRLGLQSAIGAASTSTQAMPALPEMVG